MSADSRRVASPSGTGGTATGNPPKCGWANGYRDCAVPGCKFPDERCLAVKRERGEA